MPHDIELELLTRPKGGTAVSLVAQRLRLELMDTRSGLMHDHTVRNSPDASMTVAPEGASEWCFNAEPLWNRVEWCERFGNAPIAFELRSLLPDELSSVARHRFARELAGFVARDLAVPVTFTVIQGNTPWPLRDVDGATVRMCFPTRTLARTDGSDAIGDRSGDPSGFAGRLPMTSNPHLATQFTRRITLEVARLLKASTTWEGASPRTRIQKRTDPDFPFDDINLWPSPDPAPVPSENPATHPLLARLRREAPRSMTLPDLREFELAMGMARTVEDVLSDVTAHANVDTTVRDQLARTKTAILDHLHLLDVSRETRAARKAELEELQRRKNSFMVFLRGRMELAALAREKKAVELRRARAHVEELKSAIGRLRHDERRLAADVEASGLTLGTARRELKDAVKGLHGADPRLLQHLVTILDDAQRGHVKSAMAFLMPAMPVNEPVDGSEDTRAGPPAKPSRGARPS